MLAAIWPPLYETGAVWIERGTYLYGYAYKWLGENKIHSRFLPDYAHFKKDIHSDKALLGDLHRLLNEADIVAAHNGDRFDLKIIRARLLINNYPPPSPIKSIDTLKVTRSVFKMDSAKLDACGQATGIGRKRPNTGAALWRGCYHGERKSFETMRRYCQRDVALLARYYNKIKAWAPNHPNLSAFSERECCPVCQSNHIQRRGFNLAKVRKTPRYHCQDCGHWFSKTMGR